MGHGAWGMGHGAKGMGHGAWGGVGDGGRGDGLVVWCSGFCSAAPRARPPVSLGSRAIPTSAHSALPPPPSHCPPPHTHTFTRALLPLLLSPPTPTHITHTPLVGHTTSFLPLLLFPISSPGEGSDLLPCPAPTPSTQNPLLLSIIVAMILSSSGLRVYQDPASPHYIDQVCTCRPTNTPSTLVCTGRPTHNLHLGVCMQAPIPHRFDHLT